MVTENMFGNISPTKPLRIAGLLHQLLGLHTSVVNQFTVSYPQAAERMWQPIAMVLSAALMFEYAFNLRKKTEMIRRQ